MSEEAIRGSKIDLPPQNTSRTNRIYGHSWCTRWTFVVYTLNDLSLQLCSDNLHFLQFRNDNTPELTSTLMVRCLVALLQVVLYSKNKND